MNKMIGMMLTNEEWRAHRVVYALLFLGENTVIEWAEVGA